MIPVAIVAHPQRSEMAAALAAQIPGAVLCWDNESLGAEANHLKAWAWLAEESADWGVVLEDDVILCEGFLEQLELALAHSPELIVSLYLGRGCPRHRQEAIGKVIAHDVSWIVSRELLSAQGYAMRTGLFARHRDLRKYVKDRPIDEAVTRWLQAHPALDGSRSYLNVAYAVPSLIDHRDGLTLVEHWDGPRGGKTDLITHDSDPTGANLPQKRIAWLFGPHKNWDSSSIKLEPHFTRRTHTWS